MTYIPLTKDPITGEAAVVMDIGHFEIHEGDHYFYRDALSIGAATQTYLITTPDTAIQQHLVYEVDALNEFTFNLYEGSDRVGTTAQTVWNRNRRSANTTTTTIHKSTSGGTTDGTLMLSYHMGTSGGAPANRVGGGSRSDNEIILKRNTKYLVSIVSAGAGNLVNMKLDYYEV